MTGGRELSNTSSLSIAWHQLTGKSNHGYFFLHIEYLVIHLVPVMQMKDRLRNQWGGRAYKSSGRNTRWTSLCMAMCIIMKGHAPYTRYPYKFLRDMDVPCPYHFYGISFLHVSKYELFQRKLQHFHCAFRSNSVTMKCDFG